MYCIPVFDYERKKLSIFSDIDLEKRPKSFYLRKLLHCCSNFALNNSLTKISPSSVYLSSLSLLLY